MVSFKQSRFYFLGREIVYVNPSIQTEIIVLLSKQNVLNSLTSLRHSFLLLIVDLWNKHVALFVIHSFFQYFHNDSDDQKVNNIH